jgi:hypothetical protein
MSIKQMGPRLFDSREMESSEGRRAFIGLEEGDEFGGTPLQGHITLC